MLLEKIKYQAHTRVSIGRPPEPIYMGQDNVDWNEVNKDKTELEVTVTTKRGENEIPAPKDTNQGSKFVTDHVLEVMVVYAAFGSQNREYNEDAKKITDGAWEKAQEAVNERSSENCKKVAEKISKCLAC